MSNVLELKDVRKSFGDEVVLNHLSLVVPEHTATVFVTTVTDVVGFFAFLGIASLFV